jgi:hypothetical protein
MGAAGWVALGLALGLGLGLAAPTLWAQVAVLAYGRTPSGDAAPLRVDATGQLVVVCQ